MLGDVAELSAVLAAALTREGYQVRQVVAGPATRALPAGQYEADLSSRASLKELHGLLAGQLGDTVGAVINFLGMAAPSGLPTGDEELPLQMCQWTLNVIQELEGDLRVSARDGGGRFLNVTALGGRLGIEDRAQTAPSRGAAAAAVAGAGTLGLCKTLARECPDLTVKNIDIDPSMAPPALAHMLMDELRSGADPIQEIGFSQEGRWQLALHKVAAPSRLSPLPIGPEAVVLVTGGASGIAAEVAKALAAEARPRLVLVGRSCLPAREEPPETRGLDGPALRRHLIEMARRQGLAIAPTELERAWGRIMKDRQMRANLEACRAAGATVEYHVLDVREAAGLGALIDDLYSRFGRIDGVVHAAGVIDDRRIRDKTSASFANVFRTKVTSALVLARKLRPETLKFMVFFSSVSGRFGNAGQVDYSAANEFLSKLAAYLARHWPARVVAIDWGPWDGGMVSDELRRRYASRGVSLIPKEDGVRAFLAELRLPGRQSPEVVISASLDEWVGNGKREGA
jgi:NAD(P)-dependent dehydrogenase (short-subunit alcohol dehydrogenase family)